MKQFSNETYKNIHMYKHDEAQRELNAKLNIDPITSAAWNPSDFVYDAIRHFVVLTQCVPMAMCQFQFKTDSACTVAQAKEQLARQWVW